MRISPLFDLEKVLDSELSWEVEICYVHLVEILDVLSEGVDFSVSFHPLIAPKEWFFSRVFSFFSFIEFVPCITHLHMELGS